MEMVAVKIAAMATNRGPRGPYKSVKPPTKLQQFLQSKGMTQTQAREKAKISIGSMNAAIRDKKTSPETLIALIRGLQAAPHQLTDNKRLIIQVAAQRATEGDLDMLAQAASVAIERSLKPRK